MIISSYSVLQGPARETCSQRWREGYQSLEQIIQTIFIKVCAKRICSKTFNILVHVSFATTYVNSQLQNYSDAKGGVQCNEVPCVIQMKQKVEIGLKS